MTATATKQWLELASDAESLAVGASWDRETLLKCAAALREACAENERLREKLSERESEILVHLGDVVKLRAEKKAAWKAAGNEMVWRMAVENDRDAKAKELRAVRAAVEEESKRADRAEAAARELRAKANEEIRWTKYDFDEKCTCLMCRTAWLTGGNES